jgi:hypothetical protein
VDGELSGNFRYFANYSFLHRKNRSDDTRDKDQPEHIMSLGLRYNNGRIVANLTGKYESSAESSRGPYPTTRNKDYFNLNANVGYIFKYMNLENKVYIDFRNILDDEWREHYAYDEYGTTVLMGYTVKFR